MTRQPVLVLTGPTGTGKTDWALRLAEHIPLEIVSVDSALVYRGLDIGTNKPKVHRRWTDEAPLNSDPREQINAANVNSAVRSKDTVRRVFLIIVSRRGNLRS